MRRSARDDKVREKKSGAAYLPPTPSGFVQMINCRSAGKKGLNVESVLIKKI
jgi:hypothetical protein